MTELKINPVFRDKIPPLSKEEFERLEENILSDGIVREPLVVWNGTIIDGHHRYLIIQKHPEIPYTIREMEFADEWAAIAWMCGNQLGRRNITPAQKTYLLGKLYEARKKTQGNNAERGADGKYLRSQNESSGKLDHPTARQIAAEQNTSKQTVLRARDFVSGLDAAEEVSEGFRDGVLSGEIKAAKEEIAALRTLEAEDRSKAVEEIKKQDRPNNPSKPKAVRKHRSREEIEQEKRDLRAIEELDRQARDKNRPVVHTFEIFAGEFSCIAADTVSRLRRMVSMRKQLVSDNAAEVTKMFFDLAEKIEKITEEF